MPWRTARRGRPKQEPSRMADVATVLKRYGVPGDSGLVLKRYGVFIALALLILFNFAVTPNFATMRTLSVNLTQVCMIVIVGVGMTLVIATGGIDLSVGSL